jgi:CO/xanthine dehydrogenase Mo-binding subunit
MRRRRPILFASLGSRARHWLAPRSIKVTIYVNGSMYNYIGFTIAAALKVPSHQVNIVPVDAGGSFGSKLFLHKVSVLAALGSRVAGRPVKYIEDRIDNITASDNHGSDRIYDVELALDASHRMTALRYKVVDDYGAYFQYGLGTHGNGFSQTVGPYKIRAVGAEPSSPTSASRAPAAASAPR